METGQGKGQLHSIDQFGRASLMTDRTYKLSSCTHMRCRHGKKDIYCKKIKSTFTKIYDIDKLTCCLNLLSNEF